MSIIEMIRAVKGSLSAARLGTFEASTITLGEENLEALELYAWNARVSAALLAPLHVCEIVIRNAASDALDTVYGARWPWSPVFEQSLSDPRIGYNPRRDLQNSRTRAATTGKVIPELKFVFWQKMFTGRHDVRLWNIHLSRVLPNLDPAKSVGQLRHAIYEDIEQIRNLRNRIAHHEPIFKRDLRDDVDKMISLVESRCRVTAAWMMSNQGASAILRERAYL
jgi:hypothetical protein